MTELAYINVFARDIEALARFYSDVFGFAEVERHRTPIFRALSAGAVVLGFSSPEARELLGLAAEYPSGTKIVLTFEVGSKEEVTTATGKAVEKGARLIKPPAATYYDAYQAVLADPDGNIFRINRLS